MSEIDFFKNFRINIQLLRIEKGYSSKELSVKLGFNERRISNFEQKHKPTSKELMQIAKFFVVSVEDIVHKRGKIYFQN